MHYLKPQIVHENGINNYTSKNKCNKGGKFVIFKYPYEAIHFVIQRRAWNRQSKVLSALYHKTTPCTCSNLQLDSLSLRVSRICYIYLNTVEGIKQTSLQNYDSMFNVYLNRYCNNLRKAVCKIWCVCFYTW